ncbi:hypothetical protein SDRG_10497 [Saprolegnia diclina VS20]|uniref:Uncharacterized protein n=1 Tax=Saprolegnia diclina (strain VS20) TaxID=1156394 RepID=T0Q1I1_SAPDV|nr:hypothetical protein SDRG_10497 [Saprolegnia diclina VS20]EQC31704.1 hypothetical protein SDRG_10497 [Saprolegnia diclina VS20]|eukprot:XP_008614711.1 hypothetical protein SDRG_10497 [Saprolegnia diclina VS20]
MMLFPPQSRPMALNRGLRRGRDDDSYSAPCHHKRMKLAESLQYTQVQAPEPVWFDHVSSPENDDVDMDVDMDAESDQLQLVPYEAQASYPTLELTSPAKAFQTTCTQQPFPLHDEQPPADTSTAIVLYRPPRHNAEWKTEPESDASESESEDVADFSYDMMDIDDI